MIELKKDSSFHYESRVEWIQSASRGSWKKNGDDEIIIDSFFDYENLPIQVNESLNQRDFIQVQLKPEFTMDSAWVKKLEFYLLINEKERMKVSDFSINLPYNKPIKSLRVIVRIDPVVINFINATRESLSTETYFVKKDESNNFQVSFPLEGTMLYSETIEENVLQLKGNKLYWFDKGEYPFKRSK